MHRPTVSTTLERAQTLAFACTLLVTAYVPLDTQAQTAPAATSPGVKAAIVEPGAVLEEVVVTAERREERLQDVPISVAAYSQAQLDAQALRNIDDLTHFTPGVTFVRNGIGSSGNYNDEDSDINIRGIDSTAGASTTGVYIDDTPIQSRHLSFGTLNAFPALFDLERVEVLRGPQGTLFGAGSEGGTVRFITPEPGLHAYSGYLRSELASTHNGDPSYELGAAVGGPLVNDQLGFRLSASFRRDGGWVDRVNSNTLSVIEPRSNWQQTAVLRGALKWAPTDMVTVSPSIYYQQLTVNDTSVYWPSLSNPAAAEFLNGNAQRDHSVDPFYLLAVKVNWDLGTVQMTEDTSFYSRSQHAASDYTQFNRTVYGLVDARGLPIIAAGDAGSPVFQDLQDDFYEEVRFQSVDPAARITWTAGVFYAHLHENTTETIYDPTLNAELAAVGFDFCTAAAPCPGGDIYNQPIFRVNDRQFAGYGEVNLKIGGGWKITGGLRVARDSFDGYSIYWGPFIGPANGAGNPIIGSGSSTETPTTPKVVLAYQPNPDNLVYASAAKGYRVGGVNADVGSICAPNLAILGINNAPGRFSSDSLWSYEIGAKNTLLDRRLQVNTSLFTIDWTNIQQSVYLPACGLSFVANLGQVRSSGGDIELQARPRPALLLHLSVAYVDAKYTKTICAGDVACAGPTPPARPVVSTGDRLVGAPWTVHVWGEYAFPMWTQRSPYLRADYQLTTAQTALLPIQNSNNGVSDPTLPGLPETHNLLLRAGLRWSGLDLSVFGQNVTDARPVLFASRDTTFSGLYFDRAIRPRTFGLTATYSY